MLSYPCGMSVSSRALTTLADLLRARRTQLGTRWRKLGAGRQALPALAYLRKGETYADLAIGFGIGTTTVYRYLCEALDLLAALAPTLAQVIEVAHGKAHVTLDAVYGHGPRLDDFTDGEQVGGVAARVPPAASGARAAEPSTACAR